MRSIGRLGKTRFLGLFAILAVASLPLAGATRERSPVSAGALLLLGGGEVTPEIARRFVALAGGRGRHFVYIPTAAPDAEISPPELKMWFRMTFGVDNVTILHHNPAHARPQPRRHGLFCGPAGDSGWGLVRWRAAMADRRCISGHARRSRSARGAPARRHRRRNLGRRQHPRLLFGARRAGGKLDTFRARP